MCVCGHVDIDGARAKYLELLGRAAEITNTGTDLGSSEVDYC